MAAKGTDRARWKIFGSVRSLFSSSVLQQNSMLNWPGVPNPKLPPGESERDFLGDFPYREQIFKNKFWTSSSQTGGESTPPCKFPHELPGVRILDKFICRTEKSRTAGKIVGTEILVLPQLTF